jgi:hypothetical protein
MLTRLYSRSREVCVQAFQALDIQTVLVLGTDGNLWLESSPFGVPVPPARQQVDGSVQAFQALDTQPVLVLGRDRNLWLEHGPFGVNVPPRSGSRSTAMGKASTGSTPRPSWCSARMATSGLSTVRLA